MNKGISLNSKEQAMDLETIKMGLDFLKDGRIFQIGGKYDLTIKVTGTISAGGIPIVTSQFGDGEDETTKATITAAGTYTITITDADNWLYIGGDATLASDDVKAIIILKKKIVSEYIVSGYTSKAIQQYLDLCNINGGGTVHLTTGTYILDTALFIGSNTNLVCDAGVYVKRLDLDTSSINNMVRNYPTDDVGYDAHKNIMITGGTWGDEITFENAMFAFMHCSNVYFDKVKFVNGYESHYIELNACTESKISNCVFNDKVMSTAGGGESIQLDHSHASGFPWDTDVRTFDNTVCTKIKVTNCEFHNEHVGIGSHNAISGQFHSDINISECNFFDTKYMNIHCYNWKNVSILNCIFSKIENLTYPSVYIDGITSDVIENIKISGNTFEDGGSYFVRSNDIISVKSVSITDNTFIETYDTSMYNMVRFAGSATIPSENILISGNNVNGIDGDTNFCYLTYCNNWLFTANVVMLASQYRDYLYTENVNDYTIGTDIHSNGRIRQF